MRVGFVTSDEARERDREMPNLMAAIVAAGLQAEVVSWEKGGAQEDLDVLVIRSTWNYVAKLKEFLAWARLFRASDGASNGRLLNSEATIRWNCHKCYLAELAKSGIPIVESCFVRNFAELLVYAQNYEYLVTKPAVGGGARGCSRFESTDLLLAETAFNMAATVWPEVVVQPYLDSIEKAGEIALVVIDGEIVQGLRKSPAVGDWRVQREFGGVVSDADVTAEHRMIVEACTTYVANRCGARPLYMRVDLMAGPNGESLVSEIELIEPVLYADIYPEVAARLVATLVSFARAYGRDQGRSV